MREKIHDIVSRFFCIECIEEGEFYGIIKTTL